MRQPTKFYDWPETVEEYYVSDLKTKIRVAYYFIGGFGSYRLEILRDNSYNDHEYFRAEWEPFPNEGSQIEYLHREDAIEAVRAMFTMYDL